MKTAPIRKEREERPAGRPALAEAYARVTSRCARKRADMGITVPEAGTYLTYMINIVLAAEFALEVGGAR